jgi:nicotinamide-nucleotide amidase
MKSPQEVADEAAGLADVVARAAIRRDRTIAAAESVSAGSVAVGLAAARQASTWFRGSLVAYSSGVKFDVLKVKDRAVITAEAAVQMAQGAARLLGADITVATTGAGGPDPEEGQPPGTVFIAVCGPGERIRIDHYRFTGGPGEVVEAATMQALQNLSVAAEQG